MRILIDFFPILLFFGAYKFYDIYVATGILMAATLAQTALIYAIDRKVTTMQRITLAMILVFGALTLYLQDERFIKWKPTVLYAAFAVALLVSRYAMKRNLIEAMMGKQVRLPAFVWDRLNLAWVVFFAALGVLNILIAQSFSTDVWVNFKLFGSLGLTVLFVIAQALYFSRHVQEEQP